MNFIEAFFAGKDYYANGADYFWSIGHIIFLVLGIISIALICFFFRKTSKEKMRKIFIIIVCIMFALDILKAIWSIVVYKSFDFYEDLPLHICSAWKYIALLAIFCKGKVQRCALSFACTFGIIGGLANFVLPGVLRYYPVYQFRCLESLIVHYTMVLFGAWAISSGYYRPKFIDCFYSFVPIIALSIIAISLNFIFDWDYMFYNGYYLVFSSIAAVMPKAVFIILLFLSYFAMNTLLFYIPTLIYDKRKQSKKKKDEQI